MEAAIVALTVKPEHLDVFIKEMVEHARLSMEEPGCLRYDVSQDKEDPNILYVYEVFVDEAAFASHREAPHNEEWRNRIKDWHPEDWTRANFCVTLVPPDSEWHK